MSYNFLLRSFLVSTGATIGLFASALLITFSEELYNEYQIVLSDREAGAIEHGFSDPGAAQSLEKKLTEKFGQSGFEFEVTAPEPEPTGTSGKPDAVSKAPSPG